MESVNSEERAAGRRLVRCGARHGIDPPPQAGLCRALWVRKPGCETVEPVSTGGSSGQRSCSCSTKAVPVKLFRSPTDQCLASLRAVHPRASGALGAAQMSSTTDTGPDAPGQLGLRRPWRCSAPADSALYGPRSPAEPLALDSPRPSRRSAIGTGSKARSRATSSRLAPGGEPAANAVARRHGAGKVSPQGARRRPEVPCASAGPRQQRDRHHRERRGMRASRMGLDRRRSVPLSMSHCSTKKAVEQQPHQQCARRVRRAVKRARRGWAP